MFVVAKDFVWRAGVQNGKLVHAAKDFLQLTAEDLASSLPFEPLKAFLKSFLDGTGQGFSSPGGDFSGQAFCFHAFDTKRHSM